MLTNYHTHTTRCGHAEGTEEEYILTALRCGFKVLGLSDHTPWAYATPGFVSRIRMLPSQLDDYVLTLRGLREKYADKLDWKEVSGNTNIFWSVQMLEKFKRRIDWTALSRCLQEENVSAELLEKFKDNWNWEELSDNRCLTPELIDQFADYINWKALINNWSCCEKLATEEFIRKYSDRIPACDFKDSRLWRELVEKKEKEIKKLICLC